MRTRTLYRPVGPTELFYPVLDEPYAAQINIVGEIEVIASYP